jgi:aspartate/methionine/tyrosine aminotransferase
VKIHSSFRNIGLSKIVAVSERARVLAPGFEKKSGKPFIYFQRGEVGYPVPAFIADGLAEAIQKGFTKYPKSGGEAFYKDAVLAELASHGMTGLGHENIVATMGGQEGLQLVYSYFRGGVSAGFTPAWSCIFDNILPYTETTFIPIPLKPENDWAIDFAAVEKVLPGVDTFYFNNPHNPTGRVFSRADTERLCQLCAKYGVLLLCDEAYKDLAYVGEYWSPVADERFPNVVGVNTFSKSMAATGFRVGYAVSRRVDLIDYLTRGEYTQTAGVPTPIQYGLAKALAHPARAQWLRDYRTEMRARASALADNLDPRLDAHPPEGAFYCFINLVPDKPTATPTQTAAELLAARETQMVDKLMDHGIAVVPGSAFGASFVGWARLSFSTLPAGVIADGAKRFNEVVLAEKGPAGR